MREHLRRDGAVVLAGDGDDQDQVIVEAVVRSFNPIRDGLQCPCGAVLKQFAIRSTACGVELHCHRCHRIHGSIELGVKVHR
jgi:hypothetical protein